MSFPHETLQMFRICFVKSYLFWGQGGCVCVYVGPSNINPKILGDFGAKMCGANVVRLTCLWLL